MSVKGGQTITPLFITSSNGEATNATGTPVGTVYINGTTNAAIVTVTNIAVGVYKASVTLPALTAGDIVSIRISATVAGIVKEDIIWQSTADTKIISDLNDITAGTKMSLIDGALWIDPADVRGSVGLANANLDDQFTNLVGSSASANAIAKAVLTLDWTTIPDGDVASRSLLNAARALRNRVYPSQGRIIITKEDDRNPAWTLVPTRGNKNTRLIIGTDPDN